MEVKPKRQLDVFWGRRLVGQYCLLSDETECFSYDSDYLVSPGAVPISHSPFPSFVRFSVLARISQCHLADTRPREPGRACGRDEKREDSLALSRSG